MIIDSQVHAYEANTPQRPWRTQPHGWPPHVTGDEMVAAMDKVGVDGAIFVSAYGLYGYDDSYVKSVQRAHPGRFGIVKPMDPGDPASEEIIAEWKKTPGAVAVRVMISDSSGNDPKAPGIPRILKAAAKHSMPVNLQCGGKYDVGAALIDAHPDTRFVLDHLATFQPRTRPVPADVWAGLPKIVELAKRPNAVIKVSGACTMSREPYPYADIWDPLMKVFETWGFERCLWGTDWTRTYDLVNYEQGVKPFLETKRLSESERAMLMGGATAKTYGWSPKK